MNNEKKLAAIGIISSFVILLFVVTSAFGYIVFNNLENFYWASRMGIWAVLFTLFLYSKNIEKKKFLLWNANKNGLIFYIISIVSIVIVSGVFGIIYSTINRYLDISLIGEMYKQQQVVFRNNIYILIFSVITAGITEELIFRGYYMPRIEILTNNKWLTILLSSLLFGLIHLRYGNIMALIMPFLIGLILAMHYYKYRNLSVLIISHIIIDFISF